MDSKNVSTSFKEVRIVLEKTDIESYKKEKSSWNGTFGRPFSILLESWTDKMIEKYIRDKKSIDNPISIKQVGDRNYPRFFSTYYILSNLFLFYV